MVPKLRNFLEHEMDGSVTVVSSGHQTQALVRGAGEGEGSFSGTLGNNALALPPPSSFFTGP